MKIKIKNFIVCLSTALLSSCWHSDLTDAHRGGGEVAFFQFTDSTLLNNVLLNFCERDRTLPEDCYYSWEENLCIPLYPKNIIGMPLFGEKTDGTNFIHNWLIGEKYSLEDLVNTPKKFIALKDGYYICWPFVELEHSGRYTNVEWKDLLTMDIDSVIVIENPYIKRYVIHEDELVKLTHKSTKHFHGSNSAMITIDDVVNVLNELIENGTITDHCYSVMR